MKSNRSFCLKISFAFVCFYSTALSTVGQGQNDQLDYYLSKARHYLPAHTDSAFMLARKAEMLAFESSLPLELARSYNLLGEIFFQEAAFNQSLEYLLKAEALLADKNDKPLQAENFNSLGQVYYYIRQPENTFDYHRKALVLFSEAMDSISMASTYGFIGHYFEKKGLYDSALYYQQQALIIYERKNDWRGKMTVLESLGSVYEDLGFFDRAEKLFLAAIELNEVFGSEGGAIHLYNNLGDIYYKTGRYSEAHYFIEKSLVLSRKYTDRYQERSALRDLSQLHSAEGNYQLAYSVLDTSVSLYKEIYSDEGLKQVSRLQAIFETEKKSREIELLERDQQLNKLVLVFVAAGLLLVLIAAVAILSRQRLKMMKDKELFDTRQALLQSEIENKGKSLTAHTLQIIQKNKLLKELKGDLSKISGNDRKDLRKELKKTTRKIDQSFYHDKDWEDFKQIFEQIHQSFFKCLNDINPNLSQAELRLAALIKIRMNSRDISTILGISKDSLRISRYRLRKKLKLSKEQKLGSFIQALAS
jgi:tetratricopeptide (TPR) repeat protein